MCYLCLHDSSVRKPPKSWKQFVDSEYVEVRFSDTKSSIMVLPAIDTSTLNPPTITVPNFSALSSFIKGTDMITTQLGVMSLGLLKDLDSAHQWLRQRIIEAVNAIVMA
jgi:hypothetical protein